MRFNKLYNLILESIISLNKATRAQMLAKNNTLSLGMKDSILYFLNTLPNKAADFLCKYFANGLLNSLKDKRLDQVVQILELKDSIDTQHYNGSLNLFILQYIESVNKHLQKQAAKTILYLDSVPEFSLKELLDKGVVIYRVLLSQKGMNAVRKIVDIQWGESANPWCLITRQNGNLNTAYSYWMTQYIGYPKHIAFQNGKLFALCANTNSVNLWWNLKNKDSLALFTPNWQLIKPPKYVWTDEEVAQNFVKRHNLIYNLLTKLYDSNSTDSFYVLNNELWKGHFPVPMGTFKCKYFGCTSCNDLRNLINAPRIILGDFNVSLCRHLKSLEGGPLRVEGDYLCEECRILTDLHGAPKYVGKNLWITRCEFLLSLEGLEETVIGQDFICNTNYKLTSLVGGPKEVGRIYNILNCNWIESFEGLSEKIGGYILCTTSYRLAKYAKDELFNKKYKIKFYD